MFGRFRAKICLAIVRARKACAAAAAAAAAIVAVAPDGGADAAGAAADAAAAAAAGGLLFCFPTHTGAQLLLPAGYILVALVVARCQNVERGRAGVQEKKQSSHKK